MDNQEKGKKKFYKRWWFWAIIVIVIIIIASSGGNKAKKVGDNNSQTVNSSTNSKVDNETFEVGDQVKMGDSIITVNKVEYSQGGQYSKPAEGNEWVNLNITIENTGSTQQYITTLGQMFVRDADKNSYQVSVTNKAMENPGSLGLDGQVIAKSKRTGWVGFEIPKISKGLQFQYNTSMFGGGEVYVNLGR